jgi:hypothetical protein
MIVIRFRIWFLIKFKLQRRENFVSHTRWDSCTININLSACTKRRRQSQETLEGCPLSETLKERRNIKRREEGAANPILATVAPLLNPFLFFFPGLQKRLSTHLFSHSAHPRNPDRAKHKKEKTTFHLPHLTDPAEGTLLSFPPLLKQQPSVSAAHPTSPVATFFSVQHL